MSDVSQFIANEIRAQGPITFARFMELALYCPDCGYYEIEADTVGKSGDFITSVSSGELFGHLLARQFSRWADTLLRRGSPRTKVLIIEAAAHDGRLARDILGWMQEQRPDLGDTMEYWIVEPSENRRRLQESLLRPLGDNVRWVKSLTGMRTQTGAVHGMIFCNELLDAMPVHRYAWDVEERRWFECGVGQGSSGFEWCRLPGLAPEVKGRLDALCPKELRAALPDGYIIETSPMAVDWWTTAARVLTQGWLVTLDYGVGPGEVIRPERSRGTLRAYRNHRLTEDVLRAPGRQDLTAHVNFDALEQAGLSSGLQTRFFGAQSRFIGGIVAEALKPESGFGDLSARQANQLRTLLHPDHFGRSFRVLVQSKGVDTESAHAA